MKYNRSMKSFLVAILALALSNCLKDGAFQSLRHHDTEVSFPEDSLSWQSLEQEEKDVPAVEGHNKSQADGVKFQVEDGATRRKRPRDEGGEEEKCPPSCENDASCEANELCVYAPGSCKDKSCYKHGSQSDTIQMPLKMFEVPSLKSKGVLVRVFTLPVGQGDCNIIKCDEGETAIIFDCGSSNGNNNIFVSNTQLLRKFLEDVKKLVILISHADADHLNLIEKMMTEDITKHITIDSIIVGDDQVGEKFSLSFLKKKVQVLSNNIVRNFCKNKEISFELVKSAVTSSKKNEKGMLMKLSCENCKSQLLFPGDMEGKVAKDIVSNFPKFLRSSHYKMAHHGASTHANSEEWLSAISPVEVHASHNYTFHRYQHPRCFAFDFLMNIGSLGMATKTVSAKKLDHDITCFFATGPGNDQIGKHRVYSTAPRSDKLCLIVLSFQPGEEASTEYYCDEPNEFLKVLS